MRPGLLSLMAVPLLTLLPGEAAANWITICVKYDINLVDASTQVGDDFWVNNNPRPARGMQIRIRNKDTSAESFYFLRDEAPNAGCLDSPVYLASTSDWDVRLRSRATINGHKVYVRPWGMPSHLFGETHDIDTSAGGTVNVTTSAAPEWNLAAVAGYAISRRSAGLDEAEFTLYSDDSSGYNAAMANVDDHPFMGVKAGDLAFVGDAHNAKYIIAHEVGHAVKFQRSGHLQWQRDYGAAGVYCPEYQPVGHDMFSREWGSAAFLEGTAHAYAAAIFNRTDQADCGIMSYRSIDPDRDDWPNERYVPCAGPYETVNISVPPILIGPPGVTLSAFNYYDEIPCGYGTSSDTNTATSFDWLRFWWGMMAEEGLNFADITYILSEAAPHTWWASGVGYGGPNPAMPAQRIKAAAHATGFGDEYDAQVHHGVDR